MKPGLTTVSRIRARYDTQICSDSLEIKFYIGPFCPTFCTVFLYWFFFKKKKSHSTCIVFSYLQLTSITLTTDRQRLAGLLLAAGLHSTLFLPLSFAFQRQSTVLRPWRPEDALKQHLPSRINGIYLPVLSFYSSLRFPNQKPKHLFGYSNNGGGYLVHFVGFHRLGSRKVSG